MAAEGGARVPRVAVVGSRSFTDYALFSRVLAPHLPVVLVSGGARGADALAERYAREHGLVIELIHADWPRYGRAAGPIRNRQLVASVDHLIAFWDGVSFGTASAIGLARRMGVAVEIHRLPGWQRAGRWSVW